MRKLYRELFYVPKHGKVNDKVMLGRIVITITIIVTCLVAMSFTAYAYFSYNVTSVSNTIKAAEFYTDVTVHIAETDGTEIEDSNITLIISLHFCTCYINSLLFNYYTYLVDLKYPW